MYSEELNNYIKSYNHKLDSTQGLFVMDIKQHPQITHIKYDPYNDRFDIDTSDGWHWNVSVENYK